MKSWLDCLAPWGISRKIITEQELWTQWASPCQTAWSSMEVVWIFQSPTTQSYKFAKFSSPIKFAYYYTLVCACAVCVCVLLLCATMYIEVREQLCGISSLFSPLHWLWGWNSNHQTSAASTGCTEPSHQPPAFLSFSPLAPPSDKKAHQVIICQGLVISLGNACSSQQLTPSSFWNTSWVINIFDRTSETQGAEAD